MPAPGAMGCCVPPRPQPGLEKPEGCPLLINLRDPDRKDPSYCPLADLQEGTFTTQLVSVTIPAYDPVSFWKNVKLMAVASGDLEYAEQISVPLPLLSLDNQETVSGTIGAFLVLQGYRTAPDVDGPFKWQVLSELCQLATKHGLGSPAVANMLQFLTADEITPFDIKQIAKLLCTPIQYMMFESTWRRYAEEQGLKNLESSIDVQSPKPKLALYMAEKRSPTVYLYTDSWIIASALWGWVDQWKKANWRHREKPILASELWQEIAAWVEKLAVKVHHVDAHVPKSRANKEHCNNRQIKPRFKHHRRFQVDTPAIQELLNPEGLEPMPTKVHGKPCINSSGFWIRPKRIGS
ncbi:hypothetical protein TURU_008447 [Turdus rufiventris]|nr:hypothetical protein TURU_008447 [Turdus rufiventris]